MANRTAQVAVIGAGVSGLTSGVVLAQSEYDVTLFQREAFEAPSEIAPAIWYPYHIGPKEKAPGWARNSYEEFKGLVDKPGSGVKMIELCLFSIETECVFPDWSDGLDPRYLRQQEIPPAYKYGFAVMVPLMDTRLYLPYLHTRLQQAKGTIRTRTIREIGELAREFDAVVNCSGLGARDLCKDPLVEPGRGVIVHTGNPGIERAFIYDEPPNPLTYVVPRQGDCVLGGCNDKSESTIVLESEAQAIYERCQRIEKTLPERLDAVARIRPERKEVCLELDPVYEFPVVHNYGHGGAGFTVSWGCACEVLSLLDGAMNRSS